MPAEEVLTDRGREWRSWLPVALRDSPDHLAVIHASARESERLEAAIEQVRRQFVPQTADVLLKVYEYVLGIAIEPAGKTIEERRSVVIAFLRKSRSTPAGRDWRDNVTRLVGPGWSYREHDPADVSSPPPNTLLIELPFPPSADVYQQTERLLRDMTAAHLDLQVQYSGGFVLDQSQLDEEGLG